jgi:HD-like signal output (HDOD) protein
MVAASIAGPDPFGIDDALRAAFDSGQLAVPPMPSVALELRQRVSDGNSSAKDLSEVIAADPALAGAVIRLANVSARSPVSTVSNAIARVGTKPLVAMAMSAALAESAGKKGPLSSLRREVWRNAVASALLAQDLAPAYGLVPEEAFLCGLMHDVGRLVALASAEHVLSKRTDLLLPADVWALHIDRHHLPFGMSVAESWALPSPVIEAIGDHHQAASPADKGAPAAIAAPSLMARVDELLALLDTHPSVGSAELKTLPDVDDGFAATLEEVLGGLAERVAAFMGEVTTRPRRRAAASWTQPEAIVGERARAVDIPMTLQRGGRPLACRMVAVSPGACRIIAPVPLTTGYLAKGEVGIAPPLIAHLNVAQCEADAGEHVIDAKPFGLSRPQQSQWQQMAHA